MKSGTVYRAYDAENVLLYVGCTTQPHRLSGRARNSAWWPLHDRIEYDAPLPADAALRSQTDQITLLHPRFNKNAGRIRPFKAPAVTEEIALAWKARYEEDGETIEEIALDAGVSIHTARKHLAAVGTEMRRAAPRLGVRQLNNANRAKVDTPPSVHVAFAGVRAAHRRRGGKHARA